MGSEQIVESQSSGAAFADGQFTQRFERKFFVVPRNISFAYTLLRQVCRPDSQYPEGQVNSLYFDTPDLDQYTRSSSGEFRKDKVRIRWYGNLADYDGEVPAFLELKVRQGFASSKRRQKLLMPTEVLELSRLGAGIINGTLLSATLAGFGHFPEKPLQPVIVISYWRHRFTEMSTGVRVSLDYNIRSTLVAPGLGYRERELPLRGGVVEVKGPSVELPITLRHMRLLDTDWSRFSKYSYCVESHLTDPGTRGWLWPSGRNG